MKKTNQTARGRRALPLLFAFLLFLLTLWCGETERAQERLAGQVLRLHIVANSDTGADQAIKLRVRDEVLRALEGELDACGDVREAEQAVSARLEQLAALAGRVSGGEATAQITRERFGTREYGNFSLPAGTYTALRIVLGEGKGHNWWCVVFPLLCFDGADEGELDAEAAALLDGGHASLLRDGGGVVFRFRTLELLRWLKNLLI